MRTIMLAYVYTPLLPFQAQDYTELRMKRPEQEIQLLSKLLKIDLLDHGGGFVKKLLLKLLVIPGLL